MATTKYGYVIDTMMQYMPNESYILEKLGMKTMDELKQAMELLDPFVVFKAFVSLANSFPNINPLINAITEEGSEEIVSEIYMQGSFEKTNYMSEEKSHKPVIRSIAIPVDSYGMGIEFDYPSYLDDKWGYIAKMIEGVMEAYRKEMVRMGMKALMTRPTVTNDNKVAGFYFDTSSWNADKKIIPYPNGFKTFTASEDHYKWYTTYSDDILFDLRQIIQSKGYGVNGVSYFATESTWREFKKLNTWSENTLSMFEVTDSFFTQRNGNKYIAVTEGEMEDGYVLALDTSKKILYKRVPNNPKKKGLFSEFDSIGDLKATKRADFKILETGTGVRIRGAGAIAYIHSGASEFVSPSYYN